MDDQSSSPQAVGAGDPSVRIDLDRHSTRYRLEFRELTDEFHEKCPMAWNDAHGGHWYASGNREVLDMARRADVLSNDNDVNNTRKGYQGTLIPPRTEGRVRGGFMEMDPPEQRHYRQALNPYLSPAAVARWQPVIEEITRACLDEVIETGRIDFVDHLANIVPAIVTMAMLGMPLRDWEVHVEPTHAGMYTPPDSPDFPRVLGLVEQSLAHMAQQVAEIRENPRPGLIHALTTADINGSRPPDSELVTAVHLLIGGGFDTTTALTANALKWLSDNPAERDRLSRERDTLLDSATEEFLRFFTPAPGAGRTISQDAEINGVSFKEGERIYLSWAMSNRDPEVFDDPHTIHLDRKGNRHASFGLGLHRCIGSNVARATFKTVLTAVLDRIPDFVCEPGGAVFYETVGVINGMRRLSATFTPGKRLGDGLDATIDRMQELVNEQRLAEPVSRKATAKAD